MTDPLSLTETKHLASTADTILLRATRTADLETPIGAFLRLDDGTTPAYLLESVEGGERLGRYSFLGIGPRRLLEVTDGVAHTTSRPVGVTDYAPDLPVVATETPDPLTALRAFVPRRRVVPVEGMPRFTGGAVGALALRRHRHVRAVRPATGPRSGRRPARQLHRDRPRHRLRPPHAPAVRDRVAPHRGPRPRGPLPDRRARHLRGPRAHGPPLRRGDERAASPARRRSRRRSGPRPGRDQPRPRRVHPRRGEGQGRDRRRRGDPGRARAPPVVRPPGRGGRRPHRRHRPLPRPAAGEPVALPVLHPDPGLRGRRRQPGAPRPGRGRPDVHAPDRRHATPRHHPGRRRSSRRRAPRATPRSVPST